MDLAATYHLPLERRVLGPILRERAEAEGDRTYLVVGDQTYSFRATDRRTRAIARGLKSLGVRKPVPVALLLPNGSEFVFCWYACCLLGAVMVPINVAYKGYMLESQLADSHAKGLIIHRSLIPSLATVSEEARARLEWVAVVGGLGGLQLPAGPGRYLDEADLRIEQGPDPEVPCDERDIHCVMYTSGTTGPSKGVLMPNGHFFASACVFLRALGLVRDDILFTPLPLFHGLASRLGVLPALLVGAQVVVGERFSATRFWQEVTEANATVAHTIFTIPPVLMAKPPGRYDRAHRLRAMYNAHHDPEFEERFNVRLVEAYGLTETGLVMYTPYPERREGSCGRVDEDWEAVLADEEDRPVPVGQPGEILLRPRRAHIMMPGYLNKPADTALAFRNLWFHTGDIARCDEDGYFFFVDRSKERIRRRGENISSYDVEQSVGAHPSVAECAAVPHPAEAGEDDIRVLVVLHAGCDLAPDALLNWLQGRMSAFMLPRYIEIVDELPRSPTNKVEKVKLVQQGLGPTAWDREVAGYRIGRAGRSRSGDASS